MKNRQYKRRALSIFTDLAMQKGLLILLTTLLSLAATSVSAEEKSADQWQFDSTVYLWGSTLKQHTPQGDAILINFGSILSNLDFAAMATFGARKDRFSMLTDVIYMDVSDSIKHDGDSRASPSRANSGLA